MTPFAKLTNLKGQWGKFLYWVQKQLAGKSHFSLFVALVIGVVVLLIIYGVVVRLFFSAWTDSGVFGDTFGAINALFSGLAFAGIVFTLIIQRREQAAQRAELESHRKELQLNVTLSAAALLLEATNLELDVLEKKAGHFDRNNEKALQERKKNILKQIETIFLEKAKIRAEEVHAKQYSNKPMTMEELQKLAGIDNKGDTKKPVSID